MTTYTVNQNGAAVSQMPLTAIFSLDFSQAKERGWVKSEGARWDAENKTWVLTTKPCTIGASANYGLHIIPAHLVSIASKIY